MISVLRGSDNLDQIRYKYLAYIVVRDAIGFYFGIPKFLNSFDPEQVVEDRVNEKKSTPSKDARRQKLITRMVQNRMNVLMDDYRHSCEILFEDNLWLQLLDIEPDFFKNYLDKLPEEAKDKLAVVPTWRDRDEELRRPYQQAEYTPKEFKFK
jgi:hypothetical protein